MLADGLSIDQAPGLDGAFLGVALALDDDAVVLGPLRALLVRVSIEHVRKHGLEGVVALELALDLAQEALSDLAGVGEDANGQFRVGEDVLDSLAKRDDARLPVFARPQVKASVRCLLHLHTPLVEPILAQILALEDVGQEEIQVGQNELAAGLKKAIRPDRAHQVRVAQFAFQARHHAAPSGIAPRSRRMSSASAGSS